MQICTSSTGTGEGTLGCLRPLSVNTSRSQLFLTSPHLLHFTLNFSHLKDILWTHLFVCSGSLRDPFSYSSHNMDGPEFDYIRAWSSHWPSCLLCGFMIRTAGNCGSKKSYQKVIGKQLQRAQDHDQVVIPAKKVEEDYLVNYPWLSTCTFRASKLSAPTAPFKQVLITL